MRPRATGTNELEVATPGAKALKQKRSTEPQQPLEQERKQQQKIPAAFVAAITDYDRTAEEVARGNAMPQREQP